MRNKKKEDIGENTKKAEELNEINIKVPWWMGDGNFHNGYLLPSNDTYKKG